MSESTTPHKVRAPAGEIQGQLEGDLQVFRGIPYAEPPVGELRFQPPRRIQRYPDTVDASRFAPSPQQSPAFLEIAPGVELFAGIGEKSEDCLALNVWTPGTAGSRPVMVWIYGGSFVRGSAAQVAYDGAHIARDGDVVVVTLNYRVGALGFLDLDVPGWQTNNGLRDQLAALEWVRDNIAAFGGDPRRVTVFGESAGAISISSLLASPASRGLFQRAIMQSGAGRDVVSRQASRGMGATFMRHLGLQPTDADGARRATADDILAAQMAATLEALAREGIGGGFQPALDDDLVTAQPRAAVRAGAIADIPVIAGTTMNELRLWRALDPGIADMDDAGLRGRATMFLGADSDAMVDAYRGWYPDEPIGDTWLAMLTDREFRAPSTHLLEAQAAHNPEVYNYIFEWASPIPGLRACHAIDIPFVFGTLGAAGFAALAPRTPETEAIGSTMRAAWTAFAHGRPPGGEQGWPRYDTHHRATRIFGSTDRVEHDPLARERELWQTNDS
ncbi:MAG TPA: carboxylesterase/lipase family protein [Candidatus Dormibacteraeota bacterium]|nr:carboxylesterase/lipase family protein [Candidatus Dormibacteraeota bacterium]